MLGIVIIEFFNGQWTGICNGNVFGSRGSFVIISNARIVKDFYFHNRLDLLKWVIKIISLLNGFI